MSMFEKYMKNRANLSETIKEKAAKSTFVSDEDPNEWKMGSKEPGTTYTIRWLPGLDAEALPFVTVFSFNWKSPDTNKYYNERSLKTIGKDDPVAEFNSNLWNTNNALLRNHVSSLSRRQVKHYANILVINDPINPENNGKVFYFAYGKEIANILESARSPEFSDVPKIEAFDLLDEGADFTIRITTRSKDVNRKEKPGVKPMISYEKSSFGPRKPLSTDVKYIERVYNLQHDLSKLIAPETFKTYDVLLSKLAAVVGPDLQDYLPSAISAEKAKKSQETAAPTKPKYTPSNVPKTAAELPEQSEEEEEVYYQVKQPSKPVEDDKPAPSAPVADLSGDDDDDDDFAAYFQKLRNS